MDKMNINTEEKSLKENKGGFQMPENYLDNFETAMLKKVEEGEKRKKGITIGLKPALIALAPIAAVLILGYFLFINDSGQIENDIFTNELSWDEYAGFDETWIINELAGFEEEATTDLDDEIDFLINEGVTTHEIIEVYKELPY